MHGNAGVREGRQGTTHREELRTSALALFRSLADDMVPRSRLACSALANSLENGSEQGVKGVGQSRAGQK